MGWDGSPGGPRYRAPTVLIMLGGFLLLKYYSGESKGLPYISLFFLTLSYGCVLQQTALFMQVKECTARLFCIFIHSIIFYNIVATTSY